MPLLLIELRIISNFFGGFCQGKDGGCTETMTTSTAQRPSSLRLLAQESFGQA